jgi:hypothetical protein
MNPLNFSHITKTGGSTIANISKRAGLKWAQYNKKNLEKYRISVQGLKGPVWHQPLPLFHPALMDSFDWFCVVRDPIDRCVSEFHCPWSGWKAKNPNGTPKVANLNAFIQRNIQKRIGSAHWHPQFRYIYDVGGRKIIKHVLRFDTFVDEFNALAESYEIEARIKPDDWSNRRKNQELTREDLTDETREMVLELYALDQVIYERLKK